MNNMGVMPKYYKAHTDGCIVELEPIYEELAPVVHGRWTLHRDGSGTCNECGMTQKNVWDYDTCQRYCCCCGAVMDGGSNG